MTPVDARPAILTAPMPRQRRSLRLPSAPLTAALCAVIGAVFLFPAAAASLEFDRDAVAAGQWWRLLTSHLTHWGRQHLMWDLAVFALLGISMSARKLPKIY